MLSVQVIFFILPHPVFLKGCPLDLIFFIGNAVGVLVMQIVCNKRAVEKGELLNFINTLLK